MNNFQFNESVRYLTTMNPLFDRFVSKMDDGGAADFFAFWARELESYEMDDFKATVDQISREGWGEWEHPHGLERVMERLRDARAKEVRRERNAEDRTRVQPGERKPGPVGRCSHDVSRDRELHLG